MGVQGKDPAEALAVDKGMQGGKRRLGVSRPLLCPGDQ